MENHILDGSPNIDCTLPPSNKSGDSNSLTGEIAPLKDATPLESSASSKDAISLKNPSLALRKSKSPYESTLMRIKANKSLKELSEEDYVNCLESIIERDYFPEISKLRYLKALADADASGNSEAAAFISQKIESLEREEENFVKLKTLQNEQLVVNLGKGGLKLDEFSKIFTSEDNRSFEKLTEKNIEKAIAKSSWIDRGEISHNTELARVQKSTNLGVKTGSVSSTKSEGRSALFFFQGQKIAEYGTAKVFPKNTSLDAEGKKALPEMEKSQKLKRKERMQLLEDEKLSELVTAYGIKDYKDATRGVNGYNYVHTPLPSNPNSNADVSEGFSVPTPVPRELLAERLRLKFSKKTPLAAPLTDSTPLIVEKLIAKYNKDADLQLRHSYSGKRFRSDCSSRISATPRTPSVITGKSNKKFHAH